MNEPSQPAPFPAGGYLHNCVRKGGEGIHTVARRVTAQVSSLWFVTFTPFTRESTGAGGLGSASALGAAAPAEPGAQGDGDGGGGYAIPLLLTQAERKAVRQLSALVEITHTASPAQPQQPDESSQEAPSGAGAAAAAPIVAHGAAVYQIKVRPKKNSLIY